jgi:hypothetical protein
MSTRIAILENKQQKNSYEDEGPKEAYAQYLRDCKSTSEKENCTPMFITALFIIAQVWISAFCSTNNEWVKKYEIYICNGA